MKTSRTQFEFSLVATRRDIQSKPLVITPEEWQTAIRLSRRNGFSPPENTGMTRDATKWFAKALHSAVAGSTDDALRQLLERLISFVTGEGAYGFVLEKRWERATGAL